jgi:hypothetical protein
MVRAVAGVFLIAHGLVHLLYLLPRPENDPTYPFVPETRWFSGAVGLEAGAAKTIAAALSIGVALVFLISGIAVFASADIWAAAAAVGSLLSLTLLVLFYHPWLSIGVVIDIAILADVWLAHAPASLFE